MPVGPFGELLPYDDVPMPEIPDPDLIGTGVSPVRHDIDVEIPEVIDDPAVTLEDLQALREQVAASSGLMAHGVPEAAQMPLRAAQARLAQLEPMEPELLGQEQRRTIPQATATVVPAVPAPLAPGQTENMGAAELAATGRADIYSNTFAGARQALGTSEQIAGVQDRIDSDIAGLQQRYASASPEERSAIQAEMAQKLQERGALAEVRALADDEVAVQHARADAAVKSEFEAYALAENQKVHDELAARRSKVEAEVAQKRMDREAAVAKVDEAEKRYVDLLKRQAQDDPATTVAGVAAMIGEMWQAFAERRPPNTAAALNQILELGRDRLNRQRQAAEAEVQVLSGDVSQISASIKEVEAERAEQEAAILTDLTRRLELERMRASGTPREIAIAQAEDATRGALAAKRQEATEKRAAAVQDQRLKEEEIRLKSAQADKALAEAGIASRKAAGIGSGSNKDEAAPRFRGDPKVLMQKHGLDEDEFKRTIWPAGTDGDPAIASTPEEAKELRAALASSNTTNRMLDQLIHLRQKHGGDWSLIFASPEYTELKSLHSELKVNANKSYGLGSLDEGTTAVLDSIFGGDINALRTDPLPALKSAKAQLRNRVQDKLDQLAPTYEGGVNLAAYTPTKTNDEKMVDVAAQAARGRDPDGVLNPLRDRVNAVRQVAEANAASPIIANQQLDGVKQDIATRQEEIQRELDELGGGASSIGRALGIGGKEDPGKKARREQLREEYQANQTVLAEVEKQRPKVEKRVIEKERKDKAPKALVW